VGVSELACIGEQDQMGKLCLELFGTPCYSSPLQLTPELVAASHILSAVTTGDPLLL